MPAHKCVDCGNTYGPGDGVQMYRIEGQILCELCREEREERES